MAILVFVSVVFTLYLAVDPDRTPRPKTSMLTFTREPSMPSSYASTPKGTSSIADTTATGAGNPQHTHTHRFFELLVVLIAQNKLGEIALGVNRRSSSGSRMREQRSGFWRLCRRARIVWFETASRSVRKRWRRLERQSDEPQAYSWGWVAQWCNSRYHVDW